MKTIKSFKKVSFVAKDTGGVRGSKSCSVILKDLTETKIC